jgi:hypothetical protein
MEAKINCWKFKNCKGVSCKGEKNPSGVCPVFTAKEFDKVNGGINGGRICWKVAGTFCGGNVQGTFAQKMNTCLSCEFVQRVLKEEGKPFRFL